MTQENLSPSTSMPSQGKWSLEEAVYLEQLPQELLEMLTTNDMRHLVRTEYSQWPQSLKDKMEPYLDLEDLDEE